MEVMSVGRSLISPPHIDEECFVSFGFPVGCVDFDINRDRPPHGECEVCNFCNFPLFLMQSHLYDNIRFLRRKLVTKFKEKQKTAH